MFQKNMYSKLLEVLNAEGMAEVLSEYGTDGRVKKRIVSANNRRVFNELQNIRNNPDAVVSGPVTSISSDDGSLVLVERYASKPRLIILGGGHIALSLVQIGKMTDFEVLVYDDRPAFANKERFDQADTVICDDFGNFFDRIQIRRTDYVVLVTRGHKHDTECLVGVLKGFEPAYTGMIGSARRVAIVLDQLAEDGFDRKRLDAIRTPIGLSIGAVTPGEIAVAIMAEVIETKRLGVRAQTYVSCDLEVVEALAKQASMDNALVTIINTSGSVPNEPGAKLSIDRTGAIKGTIGGGSGEAEAMAMALTMLNTGGWCKHTFDLTASAEESGMVCGGKMHIVVECA